MARHSGGGDPGRVERLRLDVELLRRVGVVVLVASAQTDDLEHHLVGHLPERERVAVALRVTPWRQRRAEPAILGKECGERNTRHCCRQSEGHVHQRVEQTLAGIGLIAPSPPDSPDSPPLAEALAYFNVSVEFALAFTGAANVWVLKAGGEGSVTATLTWDLDRTP